MAGLFGVFKKKAYEIGAPVQGECVPISRVPDPTFADEILGKGVAIIPSNGRICAPADGEITTMFSTGHAFAMVTNDGVELLVHVGLETVSLNGVPFTVHAKDGQKVKKGDLIMEADLETIKEAGREIITPVVVCNSEEYSKLESSTGKNVAAGDEIIRIHA